MSALGTGLLWNMAAVGTLILVAWSVFQAVRVADLVRRTGAADQRVEQIARQAACQLHLPHPPVTRLVGGTVTPLLWVRCRRPVVVLPKQLVAQLNDEQLCCIVAHELAHYLRRDHSANGFAFLVLAMFWWHPVVWWARRELRLAQESCCDALVINATTATRRGYSETLYLAFEFLQTERPLLPEWASGFGSGPSVRRRFEMIAGAKLNHRLSWWACVPLLALAATLPCIPVHGAPLPPEQAQPSDAASDANFAGKELRLVKLQDPSGADYYVELKGFQGRIVEIWWNGSGVVLDAHPAAKNDLDDLIPITFGLVTGGPFGGFPDWIRAYRFDPDAKEFDGSWYTFSIDTESGRVVVREVVDAALAAEIRRKAAGMPVLLPRDAKVWRILDHDALQRPSKRQRRAKDDDGKTGDANEDAAGTDKPPSPGKDAGVTQELQSGRDRSIDQMLSAQWRESERLQSTVRKAYGSFFRRIYLDLLRVVPSTGQIDDFVASDGTARAATIQGLVQQATNEKLLTQQQQRTAQDTLIQLLLGLDAGSASARWRSRRPPIRAKRSATVRCTDRRALRVAAPVRRRETAG